MLQFETLLLRQLQKQQSRDEFCDTVLYTQGVTVPVHSCVLSAFSPRLLGTLSSMPVPMAGHRRRIELQAMDAYTLLNLVSLLYSGRLPENSEKVLSAAQTLGIELPQWREEERHEGRRKEREDAEQVIEIEEDARAWDDRITGRMEGGSDTRRERGTQTECWRETDERGAQTELVCSESQNNQIVSLIDQPTNQELGCYTEIRDTALALQAVHSEGQSTTWNVFGLAPETGHCHIVSESPCVSQISLYYLTTSHNPPSTSSVIHRPPNCYLDRSTAVDNKTNDLKQFEVNIPGFINYFLESIDTQNIGRREQGCSKEGDREEKVVKSARARPTGGGFVRGLARGMAGGRGGRRKKHMERWGLVAVLAWRGQGGGRVGRLLESRSKCKKSARGCQRRQVIEAQVETRKARGRGRTGTRAGNNRLNEPPRRCRARGRPCIRPPPPPSCSFSTMTTTKQDTMDPTELDLLHTGTPTPAAQMEPIQPIDAILNDIMTGLHILPPVENPTNQIGLMSTTTASSAPIVMYPKGNFVKATESKQHLDGELNDILDHFLRTFDQQVGSGGLDLGNEILQSKFEAGDDQSDPSSDRLKNTPKTYAQLQPDNPHLHHQKARANFVHSSSTPSTQPQITSPVKPAVALQHGQITGPGEKKPSGDQSIVQQCENRRLTRNQSMKRKTDMALLSLQKSEKRKCQEKQSTDMKKKRKRGGQGRSEVLANKRELNNSAKSKKKEAKRAHCEEEQKQASSRGRKRGRKTGGVKNRSQRIDVLHESKKKHPQEGKPEISSCGKKMNVEEARVALKCTSRGFQTGQPPVKSQIRGTWFKVASSAMEKVKMFLQLQEQEEDKRANVDFHGENGRVINHKSISGAEERLRVEKKLRLGCLEGIQESEDKGGGIIVNREVEGQERMSQMGEMSHRRLADDRRQEEVMTEQCSSAFPMNLPSNAGNAPQLTSAAQLPQAQPFRKLLSPHTSTKDIPQLAESSVDEDVDVLEESSPTSELPAVLPVILRVDLSSEEEEIDDEIDVLGLEPD